MLLFSNDTLAQDSKGMSAKGRLHSVLAPLLCLLYVLDLHCAQSIPSYRQHTFSPTFFGSRDPASDLALELFWISGAVVADRTTYHKGKTSTSSSSTTTKRQVSAHCLGDSIFVPAAAGGHFSIFFRHPWSIRATAPTVPEGHKHRVTTPGTLGKSRGPPQNPAETPHNPRRDPAEPSERPPQSPLRGEFPRRASRRVVPLGW